MWVQASMRRSDSVLLVLTCCVACAETPSLASRPSPAPPGASPETRAPEQSTLPALARSAPPKAPVRILAPLDGAVLDAAAAKSLVIRVQGPTGAPTRSLELSLDGARPRPVAATTLGVSELLEPGAALATG